MTNQNICAINDYRTNVQFAVKGFYIMKTNNNDEIIKDVLSQLKMEDKLHLIDMMEKIISNRNITCDKS